MSLTRQLLFELQPFFSDDLFRHSNFYYPPYSYDRANQQNRRGQDNGALSLFNQNNWGNLRAPRHILHESEDGKAYVVEAELPGVKKEDLDVRIGDQGRSVSIKARVVRSSGWDNNRQGQSASSTTATPENTAKTQEVTKETGSSEVSNTASQQPKYYSEQVFSQTVWLPQAVSPSGEGVTAKLEDGMLKLSIPKPDPRDPAGTRITIN